MCCLKKVHFIGISGIGMSGVALFANDLGYHVSGSSDQKNDRV
ncbi:MAG: Mur ligase domain-containing protein, partial [Thermotogota bacterium]|nr:Mur ligase domain-containing protein [Thermotogota bacterium]